MIKSHTASNRHISFAEVVSAVVLCVPPSTPLPAWLLMTAHLVLIAVQIIVCRVIVIVRQQFADVEPDYFLQPLELICRPVREMLSHTDIDPVHSQ